MRRLRDMHDIQNDFWTFKAGRFVSVAEVESLRLKFRREREVAKWEKGNRKDSDGIAADPCLQGTRQQGSGKGGDVYRRAGAVYCQQAGRCPMIYTVIGHYEDTAQVIADHVEASSWSEAFMLAALDRDDDCCFIAAIPGKHEAMTPCEDSGKSAFCEDLKANRSICRECDELFEEGGDGYDGLCPGCADKEFGDVEEEAVC